MGVPITDEGRRASWLKKVEREAKANIYRKLFRDFKKRVAYEELLSEIKAYIKSGPGWAQPVMGKLEEDDSWSNWGSDFETWWVYGGGRAHADKKYQFSNYSLKYVTKTRADLSSMELDKEVGTFSETIRHIAERILNERLSEDVERKYAKALADGKINFEYEPPDASGAFITRLIESYDDGSIRCFGQGTKSSYRYQEWYKNGLPRFALIEDRLVETIEKKVWNENGKPESLMNFRKGKRHGLVCKWDKNGLITYAARFEDGNELMRLSPSDICMSDFEPVLERPPRGVR